MLFSGVAFITLLLMGVVGVGGVSAQEPPPVPPSPPGEPAGGLGWRLWSLARGHRWAMFDATAEALGLTPEEFFSELRAGKTLAEVAEQQDVELAEVRDEVNAARVGIQKQAIEQAVADDKLSRERADWLIEGLEKGFVPGWRRLAPWRIRGREPEGT